MASPGIILRRDLKEKLILSPPVMGEIVYATDTGEHGWLSNNCNLLWRDLNIDLDISVLPESVECLSTEQIFTEFFIEKKYELDYVDLVTFDYVTGINIFVSYNINFINKIFYPETLVPFVPEYYDYNIIDCVGSFLVPQDLDVLDGILTTDLFLTGYINNSHVTKQTLVSSPDFDKKRICFRRNIDNTLTILVKNIVNNKLINSKGWGEFIGIPRQEGIDKISISGRI